MAPDSPSVWVLQDFPRLSRACLECFGLVSPARQLEESLRTVAPHKQAQSIIRRCGNVVNNVMM